MVPPPPDPRRCTKFLNLNRWTAFYIYHDRIFLIMVPRALQRGANCPLCPHTRKTQQIMQAYQFIQHIFTNNRIWVIIWSTYSSFDEQLYGHTQNWLAIIMPYSFPRICNIMESDEDLLANTGLQSDTDIFVYKFSENHDFRQSISYCFWRPTAEKKSIIFTKYRCEARDKLNSKSSEY